MELTLSQYFSIIGAVFVAFVLCFAIIFKKEARIKQKQWMGIQVALGIFLIVFVCYFKPSNLIRWDIFVHYEVVNALRGHDFLYALKYGGYKEFFVANLYFWLISRLPTNSLLPVIPVFIDYVVYLYIVNDRLKEEYSEESVEISQATFTLFFWLSTFGLKLAVSGMRCVTACALASLSVYLYCKQNKLSVKNVILLIIAAGIHSFALIVVPIFLFSKLQNKTPIVVAMIVINLAGSSLIKGLKSIIPSGSQYLQVSLSQIIKYWDSYSLQAVYSRSGLGMAIMYICMVIVVVAQWYLTNSARKRIGRDDVANRNIFEYATSLALVSAGMSFSYLFVERALYLIAYSSIMTNTTNKKVYRIPPIVAFGVLALLIYIFYGNDIGTFIMNYSGKGWGAK